MSKFIIFGLGISGKASIKFLLKNNHQVFVFDDNESVLKNLESNPNLKIFDNNWKDVEALILAPGISLNHKIVLEAKKNNCPIICDIELLYKNNKKAKYIGITGTNGKSTTTALIAHIFKENNLESAVGGNIGTACLDLPQLSENGFYILETSSYQLDLIDKTEFNTSILLNITPDHIDRHGSFENYVAAKKRIFVNQKNGDSAIIGIDNINSKKLYDDLKNDHNFSAKLIPISTKKVLKDGISVVDGMIFNGFNNSQIPLENLPFLKGEHNAQNIAAAFSAAFLAKIPEEKIVSSIKSFKGLAHRMQVVGNIDKINFINDSKATNAESTENALKAYDNIFWILGGRKKEGGIKILEPYFSKVKYAFLIGEAADEFSLELQGKVKYFQCQDLENAFKQAYKQAKAENSEANILLSPACSSLDQWKNFEERGNYFCKLVSELKNEK